MLDDRGGQRSGTFPMSVARRANLLREVGERTLGFRKDSREQRVDDAERQRLQVIVSIPGVSVRGGDEDVTGVVLVGGTVACRGVRGVSA